MNKTISRLSVIVLAILLMATISVQGAVFASSPSAMEVQPATQDVGLGDTFEVEIYITPAIPIAGVQVDLSFDPSVLQTTDVTEGTFLTQSGEAVYFNQGAINNVAGTISDIYGVIAAKGVAVSQPAAFATITFTAVAPGNSMVRLTSVLLGNLQGNSATTDVTDGATTVFPDWDINLDGSHNVLDMTLIVQHFAETGTPHWIREDVNRDGAINVLDMILVGQHWTG